MWVVAAGDAFGGVSLYGPFAALEIAVVWAEDELAGDERDWHVVPLYPPHAPVPVVPAGVQATGLAPEWEDG